MNTNRILCALGCGVATAFTVYGAVQSALTVAEYTDPIVVPTPEQRFYNLIAITAPTFAISSALWGIFFQNRQQTEEQVQPQVARSGNMRQSYMQV